MGLTKDSTGHKIIDLSYRQENGDNFYLVGLAGNPNVGKSTVFNSLTGLKQHTGNWPGKTVTNAQGKYNFQGEDFVLVDLPGTYSLMASSVEEEIARDFICFGGSQVTVVVTDATCLERNLNLVLQTLEMTPNVVVCVNLIDEAKRKKIEIDIEKLSQLLGVPVVTTDARKKVGIESLMRAVYEMALKKEPPQPIKVRYAQQIEDALARLEPVVENLLRGKLNARWVSLQLLLGEDILLQAIDKHLGLKLLHHQSLNEQLKECQRLLLVGEGKEKSLSDGIVTSVVQAAETIAKQVVKIKSKDYNATDRKVDRVLTSRIWGYPIMLATLALVFWLTITGANYPSAILANFFFSIEGKLTRFFMLVNAPTWLHGVLVLGVYRTLAWVISVMLPPMAIFFPLFTFLEDLGYLPRVAFNLDNFFKRACAHGKQALTMCMGFGCNAAGVIGCRIINSPRERLIAIITNNFVPCNGRFPTLIALSTIFIGSIVTNRFSSVLATLAVVVVVLIGICMTFIISRLLSKTILKGTPSSFTLELPPYRKPQIGSILIRSFIDRTLFVLTRAIIVAAPAGLIIWSMANIQAGGGSLLDYCATFLQPFAHLIGMDGYILMAFILGLPANEIVVPIIIMSYLASGSMLELESLQELRALLVDNGWTLLTAVNVMLFSLMHFPCGTTLLTIKKETQSNKWTLVSFLVPTVTGIIICFIVAQTARLLGLG